MSPLPHEASRHGTAAGLREEGERGLQAEEEEDAEWELATCLLRFAAAEGVMPHEVTISSEGMSTVVQPTEALANLGQFRGLSPTPPTPPAPSPLLVLVDMNGTLLYRDKKGLPNCPAAFEHATFHYHFRPHAVELLELLTAHPRVEVAMYTSMRGSNAQPAVSYMVEQIQRRKAPGESSGRKKGGKGGGGHIESAEIAAVEVYDREYNRPDPSGTNHWDTMRDIDRIWKARGTVGFGFGAANTLMVDDTPRKMRHMPHNVVVVPEFGEPQVRRDGGRGDRALGGLLSYMRRLLLECGEDVREYLRSNPFVATAPGHDVGMAVQRSSNTNSPAQLRLA